MDREGRNNSESLGSPVQVGGLAEQVRALAGSIRHGQLGLKEAIGKGAFGEVFLGREAPRSSMSRAS